MDLASPEEGPHRSPPEVSPRNFSKPRRLSPDEIQDVRKRAREALPGIAEHLTSSLRKTHELEVLEVNEVDAATIFSAVPEPFAIAKFDVGGQPGWLVWESAAALSAAEILLGASEPGAPEARAFSTLERRSIERLLTPIVAAMGAFLGLKTSDLSVLHSVDGIGSWIDGGANAEPCRLRLALTFDGPGGASHLDLYLPGIHPHRAGERATQPAAALPQHLEEVEVNLVARLGANHIPLAQLLSIEVGDVIPLEAPVTEPLRLYVEDVPQPCGRGHLGSKQGNLAIRIEQIGLEDEDSLGTIQ